MSKKTNHCFVQLSHGGMSLLGFYISDYLQKKYSALDGALGS